MSTSASTPGDPTPSTEAGTSAEPGTDSTGTSTTTAPTPPGRPTTAEGLDPADEASTPRPRRHARRHTGATAVEPESSAHPPTGHGSLTTLALGAIGIVFGDIGTSPLYSLQTVFSFDKGAVKLNQGDIFGVLSLVFWSLTIIVSVKYVALVMRADNEGEGGILALVAKIIAEFRGSRRKVAIATLMGIVGAALFLGDSVITPAMSVMSAVEGLAVQDPHFGDWVLPVSVVILTLLFAMQRFGTQSVGRAFGPVMIAWFGVIGLMGIPSIVAHPGVLKALSPHYAVLFWLDHPYIAFVAMGAVVLAITGAEALYADMGHFGAKPIRMSWFMLVFPALVLNYFGQGANLLHHPGDVANPFFMLAPGWATVPLVLLATAATVIASQAVISGSYSVAQQAMRLGLFPRMMVKHTSRHEAGQIYVPAINWALYVGVLVLIAAFRSSAHLATAYGLAVTGTLILTTALFLLLAKEVWNWPWTRWLPIGVVIGGLEVLFFAANVTKFVSGGWLPLSIATVATLVMLVWRAGSHRLREVRHEHEVPLDAFIDELRTGYPRVPGTAIFPHANPATTPLALSSNMHYNHVVHEQVLVVTVVNEKVPHVPHVERVSIHDLGHGDVGVQHMTVRVGFNDSQDVPRGVATAVANHPELDLDPETALYFVSTLTVRRNPAVSGLRRIAQSLFVSMVNNQSEAPQMLRLPPDRTVVMGEQVQL